MGSFKISLSFFSYEFANIKPDIVPIAKGIGGGFPIGAVLMTKKISNTMTPGSHGSTFGGNPLAMSVGNAVIDQILKKGIDNKSANSILVKPNQIGTLTETLKVIEIAKKSNFNTFHTSFFNYFFSYFFVLHLFIKINNFNFIIFFSFFKFYSFNYIF